MSVMASNANAWEGPVWKCALSLVKNRNTQVAKAGTATYCRNAGRL